MSVRPSAWAGAALAAVLWVGAIAFFLVTASVWEAAWLDVAVYRDAAAGFLAGDDVYDERYGPAAGGLPFTYPPFALVLFVALTLVGTPVAITAVFVLNAVSLCLILHWCVAYAVGGGRIPVWMSIAAAAPIACFIEPVRTTIGFGQINLILLVIILGFDAVGQRWQGIGAGIGAAVKVTPALLVVAQLVRGDWRAFSRGVLAFLACTVVGALVTWEATRSFFTRLLWQSDRPGDPGYVGNQSLRGLWERLAPDVAAVAWLVSALLVLALGVLAVRRHRADAWASLTAAAVVGLLVSPVSWSHHWVWVLPAAAVAVKLRDRAKPLLVITGLWAVATLLLYQFGHLAIVGSVSAYVILAIAWLAALATAMPASEPTFREVTPASV